MGHFTLHTFSAFVSFGSDELHVNESFPGRANSQFAWTVTSCHLFLAAVLIEC